MAVNPSLYDNVLKGTLRCLSGDEYKLVATIVSFFLFPP